MSTFVRRRQRGGIRRGCSKRDRAAPVPAPTRSDHTRHTPLLL